MKFPVTALIPLFTIVTAALKFPVVELIPLLNVNRCPSNCPVNAPVTASNRLAVAVPVNTPVTPSNRLAVTVPLMFAVTPTKLFALTVPTTSNFVEGLLTPIPTFPLDNIRNASAFSYPKASPGFPALLNSIYPCGVIVDPLIVVTFSIRVAALFQFEPPIILFW